MPSNEEFDNILSQPTQIEKIEQKTVEILSNSDFIKYIFTEKVSNELKIYRQELTDIAVTGLPALSVYSIQDEEYEPSFNTVIDAKSKLNIEIAVDYPIDSNPNEHISKARSTLSRFSRIVIRELLKVPQGQTLKGSCNKWNVKRIKWTPIYNPDNGLLIFAIIIEIEVLYKLKYLDF